MCFDPIYESNTISLFWKWRRKKISFVIGFTQSTNTIRLLLARYIASIIQHKRFFIYIATWKFCSVNWFHIFFRKVCSCCTSVYCHIKRYVKNPIWCNLFTLNASLQGCIYTWILSLNTHNLNSKWNRNFVKSETFISKSTFLHSMQGSH